jgi:hypothetical protein
MKKDRVKSFTIMREQEPIGKPHVAADQERTEGTTVCIYVEFELG